MGTAFLFNNEDIKQKNEAKLPVGYLASPPFYLSKYE